MGGQRSWVFLLRDANGGVIFKSGIAYTDKLLAITDGYEALRCEPRAQRVTVEPNQADLLRKAS